MKIAALATIVTFIGSIIGAVWLADTHYALASDVTTLTRSIAKSNAALAKEIEITRLSGEANTLELRRASVLDKLQDAAAKPTLTPAERAIVERYKNDLNYVEGQLRDRQQQINRVRSTPEQP